MISVVLADDDALIRGGIRLILEQTDDLRVVGEAADGRGAVAIAKREKPDVVLMDVRMPEMNGIDATREIVELGLQTKVLIVTTFELDEYVFDALQAGASGFLLKRTKPEDLAEGIRTIASGESLLSPSVTRRLIDEFSSKTPPVRDSRLDSLTGRELEVLRLMAEGMSNEQIGNELYIADNTVKTHVKRVLMKLDARDRTQAVVLAYQGGLMDR